MFLFHVNFIFSFFALFPPNNPSYTDVTQTVIYNQVTRFKLYFLNAYI